MKKRKYSAEFRQNVLDTKKKNDLDFHQTAKRFGITKNTVHVWHRAAYGYVPKINIEVLIEHLKENPNISQHKLAKILGVSHTAIGYWMKQITEKSPCPTCGAIRRILHEA